MEHITNSKVAMFKRGEEVPEGAIPLTENEVLQHQLKRVQTYPSQRTMAPFNYGSHVMTAVVGYSSISIVSALRKNFKLGGLSKALTYGPAVIVPGVAAGALHELGVKNRILVGREHCSVCVTMRASIYQVLTGVCYPYLVAFLCCIPVARKNYTMPLPESVKGLGYVRLFKLVAPPSSLLLQLLAINMICGSVIAYKELALYFKLFSN